MTFSISCLANPNPEEDSLSARELNNIINILWLDLITQILTVQYRLSKCVKCPFLHICLRERFAMFNTG